MSPPRDCSHGALARSCEVCYLTSELQEACHGWALALEEAERICAAIHGEDDEAARRIRALGGKS